MADTQLYDKYGLHEPAGKVLFREGEHGEHMFIIQDGKVRITRTIGGKEHVLAVLGKGDFFGEMAIVTRVQRTATATAVTETDLLMFNREGFLGMIEKNAKIALNIIDKLCRRLQSANLQIKNLVRRNERSLVAMHVYYAFESDENSDSILPLDRLVSEISLSMDIPAERVRDLIDGLVRENAVGLSYNTLVLTDKALLKTFADLAD